MTSPNANNGFSLIELLVAVVVFSVGLLAVAGLQTVSKSANFEGLQRTTASHLAYGVLEDMRSNGNGIATYTAAAPLGGGSIAAEPLPNCKSIAAQCGPAQKAAHDLWFWETVIDGNQAVGAEGSGGGLVSPTVCIGGPAGNGAGIYTVTIAWRGVVAMTGGNADPCGAGSGLYGDNDEFRRLLTVSTYIDPNI